MSARVVSTVAELRTLLAAERAAGRTIGLVPTMGALHDGHLSLIERARRETDVVVMSLFVNPTQFNDAGDLATYPRDRDRDVAVAGEAGAAFVFAPTVEEIYPPGFCTEVRVGGPLTDTLEGAHRGAAHFHGVTTVVTKLLIAVWPDVAVFGAKDAQQVRVIARLATDLALPARIVIGPTIREPDGLALSSRNVRLGPDDRRRATGLSRALSAAATAVTDPGRRDATTILAVARQSLRDDAIEPEYLALVDPTDLSPLSALTAGRDGLLLVAATIGGVRLIDNAVLSTDVPTRT